MDGSRALCIHVFDRFLRRLVACIRVQDNAHTCGPERIAGKDPPRILKCDAVCFKTRAVQGSDQVLVVSDVSSFSLA